MFERVAVGQPIEGVSTLGVELKLWLGIRSGDNPAERDADDRRSSRDSYRDKSALARRCQTSS